MEITLHDNSRLYWVLPGVLASKGGRKEDPESPGESVELADPNPVLGVTGRLEARIHKEVRQEDGARGFY